MTPGMNLLQVIDGDMGVNLGGFQGFMTKQFLNMADWCPVFKHVGCAGVAKGMGGDVFLDTCLAGATFDHGPYAIGVHLTSPAVKDKKAFILATQEGWPNRYQITLYQITNP